MYVQAPLMIAVAPNGARKTRADHPALPLTAEELARTAAACREAGACMIHLHVRDKDRKHSLDPSIYKAAIQAIRAAVGSDMIIQISSEAAGVYQPEEQIDAVMKTRPEAVSLAIREFCPAGFSERPAAEFLEWCYRERVHPQYILYDGEDIGRFNDMHRRGMIPGDVVTLLLVAGKYSTDQESDISDPAPLLDTVNDDFVWWLCAFGSAESRCMERAAELGGHCRVGFENNLRLPDASLASDNAALVRLAANNGPKTKRPVATADQAREMMGFHTK